MRDHCRWPGVLKFSSQPHVETSLRTHVSVRSAAWSWLRAGVHHQTGPRPANRRADGRRHRTGLIYVDKKSGATTAARVEGAAGLRPPRGVIVVQTLDRLGRNCATPSTSSTSWRARRRRAQPRRPDRVDSANPDDPMAQVAVALLALVAQMERTYTLERPPTRWRRPPPRPPRRPPSGHQSQLVHAVQLRRDGRTIAEITAATGLTRATLDRHLPARQPELATVTPSTTGEVTRQSPASFSGQSVDVPQLLGTSPPAGWRSALTARRWRSCGCTSTAAARDRGPPLRDLPTPPPCSSTLLLPTAATPHRPPAMAPTPATARLALRWTGYASTAGANPPRPAVPLVDAH